MKNILILELYGYTVRGIDLRDRCPFEDHIIVSNLNGDSTQKQIDFIQSYYHSLGLILDDSATIPDSDNGVSIRLDLDQLYLEQIKALKEQKNNKF